MNRFGFRTRLFIAFSIPLLLLAWGIIASNFVRGRALPQVERLLVQDLPLSQAVQDVRFHSARVTSLVNEHLLDQALDREGVEDQELAQAQANLREALDALLTLSEASDSAAVRELVAPVEETVLALLGLVARVVEPPNATEDLSLGQLRTDLEASEQDLLQAVAALSEYENTALVEQQTSLVATTSFVSNVVLVIAPILAVIVVTLSIVITASIARPLTTLIGVAQRLGTGDLYARANLKSRDEVGQLGAALDTMASSLQAREAELLALNLSLEQRVAERTQQLSYAIREARDANRLKSEFLATMSHELRTPLNAIEGFSSIMLSGMGIELSPRAETMVARISANSKRLLHLVNDILDLSRVEAGRMELAFEPISPRELVERWQREVSILAEDKQLEFAVTVDPALPDTLYQDEFALSKITINLLSNAFKFTDEGRVTLALQGVDDSLQIIVSDTGIGIPAHAQEYIFEEFRQMDGMTTRQYGGSGLGLSLVQKLVRTMDGTIALESAPGKGSVFTVTVPLNHRRTDTREMPAVDPGIGVPSHALPLTSQS